MRPTRRPLFLYTSFAALIAVATIRVADARFLTGVSDIASKNLHGRIYLPLPVEHYCRRYLNGTHQFGCSSNTDGNDGTLHLIRTAADLTYILERGPNPPYMVAVQQNEYDTKFLVNMTDGHKAGRVSGILLLIENDIDVKEGIYRDGYSADQSCPNPTSALLCRNPNGADDSTNTRSISICRGNTFVRNKRRRDFFYHDLPFPVFLITNPKTRKTIIDCFEKFNQITDINSPEPDVTYPLCKAHINTFMWAQNNSVNCIRRSLIAIRNSVDYNLLSNGRLTSGQITCSPIADQNVFGFQFKMSNLQKPVFQSVIMLAARADALSQFSGYGPGFQTAITPIIVNLAIAYMMSQVHRAKFASVRGSSERNILFAFFRGESLDYLGSESTAYAMSQSRFPPLTPEEGSVAEAFVPFRLQHLSHVIELTELDSKPDSNPANDRLYLTLQRSCLDSNDANVRLDAAVRDLTADKWTINYDHFPPSSAFPFMRRNKEIIGVRLSANEDPSRLYKFYNSQYDTKKNSPSGERTKIVSRLATVTTRTLKLLYRLLAADNTNPLVVDTNKVDDIIGKLTDCFTEKISECDLLKRTTAPAILSKLRGGPQAQFQLDLTPGPLTRTTETDSTLTPLLIFNLLTYVMGDVVPNVKNRGACLALQRRNFTHTFLPVGMGSDQKEGFECRAAITFHNKAETTIRNRLGSLLDTTSTSKGLERPEALADAPIPLWVESLGSEPELIIYVASSSLLGWMCLVAGVALSGGTFYAVRFFDKPREMVVLEGAKFFDPALTKAHFLPKIPVGVKRAA